MQNYTVFVGIDISKQWFDAGLHWEGCPDKQPHCRFNNNATGFKELSAWVARQVKHYRLSGKWYFCMEHTGIYGLGLEAYLLGQGHEAVMECPLRISRSLGIRRGKSDPADARDIARYAGQSAGKRKVRRAPTGLLLQLQTLLALRGRLVRYSQGLKVAANELKGFVPSPVSRAVLDHTLPITGLMKQRIHKLDGEVKDLLLSDAQLKKLYRLVLSVIGVGPVIAAHLLLYTNGFTAFGKARQFACYIGVAPFKYQSGSSVHRPDRVSFMANQRMKALLSNAATVAVQHDPQIIAYVEKQRARGKEEGWIYNSVKNKLVHRIFAVVKRGTPYVALNLHEA